MELDNNITITGQDIIQDFQEHKEQMKENAPFEIQEQLDDNADKLKELLSDMSISCWLPKKSIDKFVADSKKSNLTDKQTEIAFNNFKRAIRNSFIMMISLVSNSIEIGITKETMHKLQMALNTVQLDMIKTTLTKHIADRMFGDILKGFMNRNEDEDED